MSKSTVKESSPEALDSAIASLAKARDQWLKTGTPRRLLYLETCRQALARLAPRWAKTAALAKGLGEDSALAGEEWMLGPLVVARGLRLLQSALQAKGRPHPVFVHRRIDGRDVVRVFPSGIYESLMWLGMDAEVWVDGKASQGRTYTASWDSRGKTCLVLGAGNVSSIAATDMMHKLFVENQVVLLKMNPVNEYLGPILEEVFYPLVRDGFLRVVYGGVDIGSRACSHPQVDTIHITGSHHTYQAIKNSVDKPLTAELGCVSPVLLVGGSWTQADLRYHARQLAGMMSMNAGCNCVAPQVLILHRQWGQREEFLAALRQAIGRLPSRPAYYPGALDRRQTFLDHYPQAVRHDPWTFIPDLKPESDQPAFQMEAFCGLTTEISIDADDPGDFLLKATAFANRNLWGNLSCTVFIHPRTERTFETQLGEALEELAYGTIGLNLWPGVAFGLMSPPWGAYPGNTPSDIQSGVGHVHNTFFLDHPEKTVLRGPFTLPFLPPWFPNNPKLLEMAKILTAFEIEPTFKRLTRAHATVLKASFVARQ